MMKKRNISIALQDDLLQWIKARSDATGVSVSGLISLYICEKRDADARASQ